MSGSWQAERGRRLPCEDPHAQVGEDVRVGVGPMEFLLNTAPQLRRGLSVVNEKFE